MKKTVLSILICIAIAALLHGCCKDKELVIFHAGSLSVPFREISKEFQKMYPHITVKAEASGSRSCARKISDLKRNCDVMGSADYKVVDSLLVSEYADFNIKFALNEMVIAYTDESLYSDVFTGDNWYDILLRDKVAVGRSDPDLDPCGYRTLIVFQLAEIHFNKAGLAKDLESKDDNIRPKETDLLVLLEAGEIDYLFIYRSVAVQHGLNFITLADEINLKSEDHSDFYKTASVTLSGKRSADTIIRIGEPMVYSVTMPKSAQNHEAALNWIALLLSPKGQSIMERNGQPVLNPAQCESYDQLPEQLKSLCDAK